MSESNGNGTVDAGSAADMVEWVNRVPDAKVPDAKKSDAKKSDGSVMGFYERCRVRVAKKKSYTFKAEDEKGAATLTVKTFPELTEDGVKEACKSLGCETSIKSKNAIKGKEGQGKATWEGEFAEETATDFFAIDTASKDI